MTKISVVLSVSAGVLVGLRASAHADPWRVCNKTLEELFVAVGYHDKENQSISRGWGTVPSCRCINALTYDKTDNTNVYLYAENRAGVAKFTSDGPRLCVSNPGHFVYRNGPGNPCSGRVVGFDKVHLRTWPNVYTTNLESGDTCSMDPG